MLWVLVAACMLSGCASNLGGSYTRLYPVTSYEVEGEKVYATYTIEDGSESSVYFSKHRVYLHDGENTVIVISSDKDGTDFDGVKEFYLYLNEGDVIEKIKEKGHM